MNILYAKWYFALSVASGSWLATVHTVSVRPLLSPLKIEFAFDIDDVLLTLEKGITSKLVGQVLIHPSLWKDVSKIRKSSNQAELLIQKHKHKNKKFARLLCRAKQGKTLIKGMVTLLQELKDKGYTLYILSNMSRADFEFYKKKFPELFNCFSGELVVEPDMLVQKPHPAYFEMFRLQFPTNRQIFFIDDKEKNCKASGFAYTHLFKSAKKLRADLESYGIL